MRLCTEDDVAVHQLNVLWCTLLASKYIRIRKYITFPIVSAQETSLLRFVIS